MDIIPSPCPEGTYYKRTKGYRRVSGDKCHGGVESRLEPDRVLCPVKEQDEFILYTTRSTIHKRSFTNQRDEVLPLVGLQDVIAVEFDYQQNCLYWADAALNVIQKVCLSKNSSRYQTTIVSDRLGTVESLALDWMSNILYWVDSDSATIEMARTDGTHRRLLITNNTKLANGSLLHIKKPRCLVVYPKYGLMFWSDWSDNPSITRSYMDGSHIRTLVSRPHVHWPNGLAIDDLHERLFWTDGRLHGVFSVDLYGNNFQMLIQQALWLPHPYSVAVYKDYVYWTDWSRKAILRTSLHQDHRIHMFMSNISGIMDMKILHYASQQGAGSGPCSRHNGQCTSICVERPVNMTTFTPLQRTCLCSDVYEHIAVTKTGEEHCECPPGEMPGPGDGCMRINASSHCQVGQFTCANGKCIPATWRCDRDHDCGDSDNSDEMDCDEGNTTIEPGHGSCNSSDSFLCDNQNCITLMWRCDGEDDCGDNSDETSCNTTTNVTCTESWHYLCSSDSVMTTAVSPSCDDYFSFDCGNTVCIPMMEVCDGVDDCGNNGDEEVCGNVTTTRPWITSTVTLPPDCYHSNDFLCNDGDCIKASWVCDGYNDCKHGDDELNCSSTCPKTYFRCLSTPGCIPPNFICDGEQDCADNSDEIDCRNSTGYRFNNYWTSSITPTSAVISWGRIKPNPPTAAKVQVMYRVVTNSYTVRREKAKSFPTDPRSLSDLEIPQEWTLTSDGKPFLIHDGSADSSERMIKNSGHPWHNKTKIWIDQDVDSIKVNGLSPGHIYEYTLCIVINGDAVYACPNGGYPIHKRVAVPSGPTPAYYNVNFTEFLEGEEVSVWVTAINVMEGERSDVKEILIQVANKPHCCQVLNDEPYLAYTSVANIRWKYQGDAVKDHIDSFRLVFIPEDTFDVNITQTVIADNANTGQEDYVASVTGWSPDLKYLGYIQAHNTSGPGVPAPIINTISQDADSHDLTIQVTTPKRPIYYTEGDWKPTYIITVRELWPNGSVHVEHGFPINSSSPRLYHVIHDLHRGATYTVSVARDVIDARASDVVRIWMSPHQAPTHFSLLPNLDDGIVFLQWRPPKVLPKSNFTYGIYHAVADGNYTLADHVKKNQQSYAMLNLEPSRTHKFKVRMDDVYGYPGEFTPVETFTTPSEDEEEQPMIQGFSDDEPLIVA
ncbi:hypothetical protein LSH36_910g01030 [Paralvinella palmiformis]|uniref:Sortilin-related receptor n=1 Tax=Paralvinella palmiformis TaxID=53620 RepID=A0AAD9IZ89_9ANNE|nr:hypothetical protein LSH36_910g01030 [Paralvinella palmiformis]